MTQTFLTTREKRGLIARFDDDETVGIQPGLRERGRKQVWARDAPQHLARRSRGNACSEQNGCSSMHCSRRATRDLMERGDSQTASGQGGVDLCNPKR